VYLGISGGIGSGKSTAAKMFADLGAIHIDADAIAKEVLEPGQVGYESVLEKFGDGILDSSGNIDRKELAKLVFNDSAKLSQLEDIIHPAVIARVAQIRESLPETSIVLYDTPLLLEKQMQAQFDKIIMVLAPTELRESRLIARGLAAPDIAARMRNQASDDARRDVADYILVNDGTLESFRTQVEQVWRAINP
jgi:dephospho-CoA kinase